MNNCFQGYTEKLDQIARGKTINNIISNVFLWFLSSLNGKRDVLQIMRPHVSFRFENRNLRPLK